MSRFGKRLKWARRRVGMSQGRLAALLTVSRASVQRWERGADYPSAKLIAALSFAVNVSIFYLLGVRDTPERGVFLADEELALLELFRLLSKQNRDALIESVKDLLRTQQITAQYQTRESN